MTDRTQPDSARVPLSASAPAPWAHIKEPYTLAEIKAKIASHDYSAEMLLQHAMLLLDGATLSANAGEPVAWMTFTEEGEPEMVFLDRLEACQYCEDDDPPKPLYLAAPPTAQAEGWVSVEDRLPAANVTVLLTIDGKHITTGEYIRSLSCFSWNTHDDETDDSRVTHWMPPPPPPTSAEGVEHG